MLDTSASFLVLTPRLTLWMLSCAHQKYDAVFVLSIGMTGVAVATIQIV